MENLLPTLSHIWNVFVKTNTFNFVIFVLIFAWLFKKINVKGAIDSLQTKIIEILEAAKKAKKEANRELKEANKAVGNLEEELKIIIQDASKSAEMIGEKLLLDAKKQALNIETNALKVIDAEEKRIIARLSSKTSKASVEVAKSNIQKALEQNPGLHEKYINESIDSLDSLNF